MRPLGLILTALIALAVLQAAVKAIAILGLLAFAWLVFTRPRETVGFILFLVMLGLAGRYPAAAFATLSMLLTLGLFARK